MQTTLYDLLEIDRTATAEQIDDAHLRAKILLTDEWTSLTGVGREHLDAAHTILSDGQSRSGYDKALLAGVAPSVEDVMRVVYPPEDTSKADKILSELAQEWPDGVPRLPSSVSEISNWKDREEKYRPLDTAAPKKEKLRKDAPKGLRARRAQTKLQRELRAGHASAGKGARVIASVMICGLAGGLGFGGYTFYTASTKPLAPAVGLCTTMNAAGVVTGFVNCSQAHQGYASQAKSSVDQCRSETSHQVIEAGVLKYVLCIDRTA